MADLAEQGCALPRPIAADPVEAGALEGVALLVLLVVLSGHIHYIGVHNLLRHIPEAQENLLSALLAFQIG